MWRSRLLPRPLVMVGLIGGPLALLAGIGVLLGAWDTTSGLPVALTAGLPAQTAGVVPAGLPEPAQARLPGCKIGSGQPGVKGSQVQILSDRPEEGRL